MTTFYICRHGQTENNLHQRLSGWIDTPLTLLGIKNAATSATKLQDVPLDMIISSDLGRAFITAYIIATNTGHNGIIILAPELREVNYGDLANRSYSGTDSVYPELSAEDNAVYVPPNGESLVQMQQRVLSYVNATADAYPNKTILLVTHDGTINALYAHYSNQNIGVVDAERANAHDFVGRFTYHDGAITSFEEVA